MPIRDDLPNLKHLRILQEVARTHSANKAAEAVHLSQAAISQAIKKLEAYFGVPLFERRSTGTFPTEFGDIVVSRVGMALRHIELGGRLCRRVPYGARDSVPGDLDRRVSASQIRALVAMSNTESIALAARELGISSPSLHRALRDLEYLVGAPLYERTGRGLRMSDAGEQLARYFRLALKEIEQAGVDIQAAQGILDAQINVGTLPLCRTIILPRAILRLKARLPSMRIKVWDGSYDVLLNALRNGDIDILLGALRKPPPVDDVVEEHLFADQISVLARSGHPLSRLDRVTPQDLAKYPWIISRRGTPLRARFDTLFKAWGIPEPGNLVEASSMVLVRGVLLGSDHLTMLSRHQLHYEIDAGMIAVMPIDTSSTARSIGMTLRRGWQPSRVQVELMNDLRAVARGVPAP